MDKRLRFMTDLIAPLRVPPGSEVKLHRDHDPGYTGQVTRPQAAGLLAEGVELLADYQDRLAAQDTFGLRRISWEDFGFRESFGHYRPQKTPMSPNTPG